MGKDPAAIMTNIAALHNRKFVRCSMISAGATRAMRHRAIEAELHQSRGKA